MGLTKAQKRKAAKRKARERRIRKEANVRHNRAPDRYRLDVLVDGRWLGGVMRFNSLEKVEQYVETTETRRRVGEEIAPGRVTDESSGELVREIPGSRRKGALPDAIADGPKADPNVTGKAEEKPVEVEPKKILTGEPDSR
jgi:hypothetical protein